MREIHVSAITDTVAELAVAACCRLPGCDVPGHRVVCGKGGLAFRQGRVASAFAERRHRGFGEHAYLSGYRPCPVVFAEVGPGCACRGRSFEEAVNAGVAKGYTEGYLRKSSVAEPLFERKNTGDNTPAVLHVRLCPAIASA